MAFELHVWGPAFGLPSIDAECLAAIAYLKRSLPPEQWSLVVQHDASVSPTGRLPALRNISQWVGGFESIVQYLGKKAIRPDEPGIESQLRADYGIPLYLRVHSAPLLATHLYTTQKNWVDSTRPAFTKFLPGYANYIVPPALHKQAEQVAAANAMPVGIEGTEDLPPSADPSLQAKLQAQGKLDESSPSLLFIKSRQSVQEALQARQMTTRFRLEVLIDDLLDVVEHLLPNRHESYLYDSRYPTTIDCAIYGYLVLLITPLGVDWIPDLIAERHPNVKAYVERLQQEIFPDSPIEPIEALTLVAHDSPKDTTEEITYGGLPYRRAAPSGALDVTRIIARSAFDHLISPRTRFSLFDREHGLISQFIQNHLPLAIGVGVPAVAGIGYLVYYFATLRKGHPTRVFRRSNSGLSAFSAAGAALSGVLQGQTRSYPNHPTMGIDGPDLVDLGGTGSIAR